MSWLPMWKSAWVLRVAGLSTIVVASAVSAPAAAWAAPPDHGTFASHNVFVDSDVCAPEGFSVDVVEDDNGTFQVFFDSSGEVTSVFVHHDYRAVISANGHTIVERDKWMNVYNPDGTLARIVGDSVHIQGPGGGLVQHDAGQIVFNADGSVAAIHGPHPQFEGQTFCFALLP